jgi:DNA-binding NtrC family response regulator
MEPLLLVEDKNELRAMLKKALERAGYTVDEAPDGTTAIQKVRARRYLMVITDLKMPGASGLDVLRESKQADATIPVLLLTAFGSVEEAVSAMKEGAFDFLQKPVDLDHLKLLVQRATRQQEMQRENLLLREEYTARSAKSASKFRKWPRPILPFCFWAKAALEKNCLRARCIIYRRGASSRLWR